MTHIIDLRSDTVTRPTPAMRAAIAAAEVGDDIFGEDPTVNRLEERFAALAGKEAALFVSSGSQGNQIAIKCHTSPGDEILCDANSHMVHYETAAPAAISGVAIRGLDGDRGVFGPEAVAAAVRPDNIHSPRSRLVVIENTHNRGGGTIWPIEQVAAVSRIARERGLAIHMDGARLFNAVVATGIALREWASHADSVSVCFSKGLGAPVGSILAGSRDFIARARRVRKMLGGAMRQAGILAAAAEYALDHHIERLAEDHAHARLLASLLAAAPGLEVETLTPPTNMVYFRLRGATHAEAEALSARWRARGVLVNHTGSGRFRAVTHLDVSHDDIRVAARIMVEESATMPPF
ncbi:MAG: low-specificity L-threonine aldolase [Candidatus Sumerlaeaceae bacterium]|nr:low-specificity L-threonine aldolase [Candidatus Sumerlaeaceae bacterium]